MGGRSATGGADPTRRRVRPAARGQRSRSGRGRRPGRRRHGPGGGGARRRDDLGPGGRAEGRAHGHRGTGRRASRWRRSRTRPWPAAGPATSWPGTIGALLAQGLAPFAAARLGVYLHGAAGEAVRERLGRCRRCSPRTCPTAWPIARKRLAALAEGRRGRASGSGFGAREVWTRRSIRARRPRRDGPAHSASVTHRIGERLAAAGSAAAAADGLARDSTSTR